MGAAPDLLPKDREFLRACPTTLVHRADFPKASAAERRRIARLHAAGLIRMRVRPDAPVGAGGQIADVVRTEAGDALLAGAS